MASATRGVARILRPAQILRAAALGHEVLQLLPDNFFRAGERGAEIKNGKSLRVYKKQRAIRSNSATATLIELHGACGASIRLTASSKNCFQIIHYFLLSRGVSTTQEPILTIHIAADIEI
jgi:hypothetical protein